MDLDKTPNANVLTPRIRVHARTCTHLYVGCRFIYRTSIQQRLLQSRILRPGNLE